MRQQNKPASWRKQFCPPAHMRQLSGVPGHLPVDRTRSGPICASLRRGGRAVECTGLENRQGFAPFVGSNPTLSAIILI